VFLAELGAFLVSVIYKYFSYTRFIGSVNTQKFTAHASVQPRDTPSPMTLLSSPSFKADRRTNITTALGILAAMIAIAGVSHSQVTSASLEGLLSRAIELERSKDYAGAEAVYKEALLTAPDDPEIQKRLGLVCQEQGKYDESIETFQKILKRAPVYPGVNAWLGISYYALNKFDKTIEATQKELTSNPTDKQARYYLALALSASGRLFEAIQQLEGLLKDDPQNMAFLYQLVVDYRSAAQQAGQKLAKEYPDSAFTHAIKAEVLADGERFDEAILEFKEVLRRNPDFPGIHLAIGQVYWRRKDLEKAHEELKLAVLEDPNQPLANYYLADILVTDKEYLKAIPHLEITISVYPELTRAYWLLGKCWAGTGDSERALQAFKKALEQDPNYKEVHFQLHELYAQLGNKEESQKHLQIFERLTREDHDKDRTQLQEAARNQKDPGTNQ
jgi:tetratricopeptide (TPR) repeat protein